VQATRAVERKRNSLFSDRLTLRTADPHRTGHHRKNRGPLRRYAVAVGLGGLAILLGCLVSPYWHLRVPLTALSGLFVVLAAWLGGIGPGVVCTVLVVLGVEAWLLRQGTLSVGSQAVALVVLGSVGVGLSVICDQLLRARRGAERAADLERRSRRIRDRIIGIVAHDLANPLVAIDVNAELIDRAASESPLREEFQRRTGTLHRSVVRIRRMLLDLLDAATLESGKISVAPSPLPAAHLMRETADLYREDADRSSVALRLETPGDPPEVWADHNRILQVLSHMTNRALMLTPQGGQVTLRVERIDGSACFAVHPNQGAEPQTAERADATAPAPEELDEGGDSTLRVSLAKAIVEAHGGRLLPERGGEARRDGFAFTLPVATAASGAASSTR
jgi:signal transduction histidine kinase